MAKILLAEDDREYIGDWLCALKDRGVCMWSQQINRLTESAYNHGLMLTIGSNEFHLATDEVTVNRLVREESFDAVFLDFFLKEPGNTAMACEHLALFAPERSKIILISSDPRKQRDTLERFIGQDRVQSLFSSGRLCTAWKNIKEHLPLLHELTGLPLEPLSQQHAAPVVMPDEPVQRPVVQTAQPLLNKGEGRRPSTSRKKRHIKGEDIPF